MPRGPPGGVLAALTALVARGAWAQEFAPPDLPAPKRYPDLQVDGEWWYYKLLDTQFPHDVVALLQPSAFVPSGSSITFKDLPQAKYILLEFFAPWCPHCQHFAPELAKATKVLQEPEALSGELVAVLAVDCERQEMRPLCSWGGADMFPKLVLAPREVLMGQLGALAKDTSETAEKFPVTEASEVMSFLQAHISDWPQDVPAPASRPKGAPFFGWSQPVSAAEPQQVPAQDVAVAAASLLHQAFSTLNFDGPTKAALLQLLGLLCTAGPGSACRQSACVMQEGLGRRWDELASQTVITKDPEYHEITPFTVTHLDWARVEHEYQWCDRPWTEFASEGWDWCRGQTTGSRGYTCGLWLLFHSLLAGSAEAQTTSGGAATQSSRRLAEPAEPALQTVRGTVEHFFGCADCRKHFLAVPVLDSDLATPEAQMLWLWKAHNEATVRIGQEEHEHSADAPPRRRWPSAEACPSCHGDDGSYNDGEVLQFLRGFYGGAYADESQQRPAAAAQATAANVAGVVAEYAVDGVASAKGVPVQVQVFYFTLCPHCEYFLRLGLLPLIQAQLPGEQVQASLVPMYPPLLHDIGRPEKCRADDACNFALAPMCALQSTFFQPSPADSQELRRGVEFAACDVARTAEGKGQSTDALEACAKRAGLEWHGKEGLKDCVEGDLATDLLDTASKPLLSAMGLLHDGIGFQEPPSMPWILVDGELLSCDGDGARCTDTMTAAGLRALPQPGTLLELVCSRLDPRPSGCDKAAELQAKAQHAAEKEAGGVPAAVRQAKDCEDCAEIGAFHWTAAGAVPGGLSAWLCLAAVAAAAACAAMARASRRRLEPADYTAYALPEALLE